MHFGNKEQLKSKVIYTLNNIPIVETFLVKDLGIYISPELNWDEQVTRVCAKSTAIAKKIFKCFQHKSVEIIKKLYTSSVRPILEYANSVWTPTTVKHVKMLERVQKRCTKLGDLSELSYNNRLSALNLLILSDRRLRGDHIQVF